MDYVTRPRPFQELSVVRGLGLDMINLHTKFAGEQLNDRPNGEQFT